MSQEILFAEAAFGRDVNEFLESDVGRFLIGRAEQEIKSALELLKKADASNPKEITMLQNQIWIAESISGWLKQAVEDGLQAERILEDLHE